MTVATYRRIWCDGPGSGLMCGSSFGMDIPGETAADVRKRARSEGWRRDSGRDICPDCQRTEARS
ncbi:hypothetical protein [Streptomyces flavidovirens]